ncbi:trimethylamine methyltransferase family protein [Chloroflexota bacterium]
MNRFRILSKQDVQKLHSTALDVLDTMGLQIHSEKVRKMLEEAGAKVNHETMLVHFPPSLVDESVKKAPQRVIYGARNPKYDLVLEPGGSTFCRPGIGAEGYMDLETGKYRHVKLSDVKDWAILVDALENISYYGGPYPSDVPLDEGGDIHVMRILLENTEKHIAAYTGKNTTKYLKCLIDQSIVVMGSEEELRKRPLFCIYNPALSPLQYEEYSTDILILLGKYGIPVELSSMPIAGGTAPVTIAGTIMLSYAEILTGIVIAEIANPGAPIVYRPEPVVMDMSSGVGLQSAVENAMMSAAGAQLMGETYNIPTNMMGLVTDSPIADGQSMIEKTLNTLLPALAGANIVKGAGYIENVYTADPVQLVIDNDILGMTYRLLQGFEVSDNTLGVDALARVGPGGNFLTDKHTLKYFKSEYSKPHVFNRMARDIWQQAGAKDVVDNAKQRAKTILREHKPAPLAKDVIKELDSIIKRVE